MRRTTWRCFTFFGHSGANAHGDQRVRGAFPGPLLAWVSCSPLGCCLLFPYMELGAQQLSAPMLDSLSLAPFLGCMLRPHTGHNKRLTEVSRVTTVHGPCTYMCSIASGIAALHALVVEKSSQRRLPRRSLEIRHLRLPRTQFHFITLTTEVVEQLLFLGREAIKAVDLSFEKSVRFVGIRRLSGGRAERLDYGVSKNRAPEQKALSKHHRDDQAPVRAC